MWLMSAKNNLKCRIVANTQQRQHMTKEKVSGEHKETDVRSIPQVFPFEIKGALPRKRIYKLNPRILLPKPW